MKDIHTYTIKLIRYVLKGDVPELPENIDFELLYEFSKSHGVENMIYVGLRDLKIEVPEPTMQKFKEAYEMAIMVEAMQAIELEQISNAFEEAGIDHIPLKGSVIKYLYPDPSYRKSGDIDILIRNTSKEKISKIMFGLGYKIDETFETYEVHYAYKKKPFFEVEIHTQLVKASNRAYKFCNNVWDYTKLKRKSNYCYEMTNEFLYTHLLAHLCNHLYMGGAGIRIITDFYVARKQLDLDEKRLKKNLKKTNLSDIDGMVLKLIDSWYGESNCTEKEVQILGKIVFENGSFGTMQMHNVIVESNSKTNKLFSFVKRLFPSVEIMKNRYLILERKGFLLPFLWIYRFFDIYIFERNTISEKIKESLSEDNKNNDVARIVKFFRDKYDKYER